MTYTNQLLSSMIAKRILYYARQQELHDYELASARTRQKQFEMASQSFMWRHRFERVQSVIGIAWSILLFPVVLLMFPWCFGFILFGFTTLISPMNPGISNHVWNRIFNVSCDYHHWRLAASHSHNVLFEFIFMTWDWVVYFLIDVGKCVS